MTGRAEIERQKQKLDATFDRASGLPGDAELLSDFARYLCVLVSAFWEQSIIELLLEHVRNHSSPSVQTYVERQLRQRGAPNAQRTIDLLGVFNDDWRKDLDAFLIDDLKDAVDSIVALRNGIAHGRTDSVTMARASTYYERVKCAVEHVVDLCAPERAAQS
jgi:hypothetical protein